MKKRSCGRFYSLRYIIWISVWIHLSPVGTWGAGRRICGLFLAGMVVCRGYAEQAGDQQVAVSDVFIDTGYEGVGSETFIDWAEDNEFLWEQVKVEEVEQGFRRLQEALTPTEVVDPREIYVDVTGDGYFLAWGFAFFGSFTFVLCCSSGFIFLLNRRRCMFFWEPHCCCRKIFLCLDLYDKDGYNTRNDDKERKPERAYFFSEERDSSSMVGGQQRYHPHIPISNAMTFYEEASDEEIFEPYAC